jgi:FkbM family methyltransferase
MKTAVKYILHTLLGFRNYLYLFSRYKIATLRNDKKEGDFFCFLAMLPADGTVLDIGANIGIMTVHLALNSSRQVVAFEPMPHNLDALYRIITHYKLDRVKVIPYALGNENGKVEMVMPMEGPVRMQGLSHVVHESIPEGNKGERFVAELRTLDSIPELKEGKRITGVKMDVENFEYYVLEGGQDLLRKHRPLLYIELWENENRRRCFHLLENLGYTAYVVNNGALVKFDKQKKQNFIFLSTLPKT